MSAEAGVKQAEEDEKNTADKARDGETLPHVAVDNVLLSMKLQVTDVASREQGHAKIRLLVSNVSDGGYSDDNFERDMFLLGGVLVVFGGRALVLITKYCLQEITPSAR
ncbi:hypothetical protein Esi_0009_0036 [Ectocarpus siliculosus]|uniref:Uncharacterized protein n=1 Tax=Ectocarpus siliculosus TaxID=2880 RepID=D8LTL6_ECTSI|nr:hypothetical protein Esi_0009_0036 [Ectocarpus siliculosus]|eukprot:CBN73913.1 hypothetical protein Esi_0009_0036 [Ectocarpus siliculosus]